MNPKQAGRLASIVATTLVLGLPPDASGDAIVSAIHPTPAPARDVGLASWTAHLRLDEMPTEPRTHRRAAFDTADLSLDFGIGRRLPAVIDRVVRHDDTRTGRAGVVWSGRVLDGSQSTFVLARVGDAVAGAVWHSELGAFSVLPTGDRDAQDRRLARIVQSDPMVPTACGADLLMAPEAPRQPEAEDAPERAPSRASAATGASDPRDAAVERPAVEMSAIDVSPCDCGDDGSQVDILIVYTAQARDQAGGTEAIEAVALASVESMNLAMANSAVNEVELHLVATELTSYNETLSGVSAAEVTAMHREGDGIIDDVHPLRAKHRADVVAMLRGWASTVNWGIAFINVGAAEYGFSITRWDVSVGELVFAHEVGHNFGLTHDRANAGATYCHHAFGMPFSAGAQTYGTVMSYPGITVPHFSNPDVTYLGAPTGVALGAGLPCHNAFAIQRSARALANNVQSVSSFADCNGNGQSDCDDVASGVSADLNDNGVPDECEARRYVNPAAPEGGDGLSWATAFHRLSDAIGEPTFRCGEVVEIWVAKGTHVPTRDGLDVGRQDTFWLAPHMHLLGGFAGDETDASDRDPVKNLTILSGDRLGNDGPNFALRSDNCYRVVGVGAGTTGTALIDGFTIRGGNANVGLNGGSTIGGGILGWAGAGDIRNCVITDNSAAQGGGALIGRADVEIVNCLFTGNRTAGSGGLGAGLLIQNGMHATVVNCTITANTGFPPGSIGAGMLVRGGSTVELVNSVLWSNQATSGAQLAVTFDYPASQGEAGSGLTVWQSAVSGGQPGVQVQPGGILNWLGGNLTSDPMFVAPASGNWRLLDGSPCVDVGDNTEVPADVIHDLDRNPRFVDGNDDGVSVVDLGAYETQPAGCLPADFDCDGDIDGDDLGVLLASWGPCAGCEADLDGDGAVSGADLGILLGAWW